MGDTLPSKEIRERLLSTAFDKYDNMEKDPTLLPPQDRQDLPKFGKEPLNKPLLKEKIENLPFDSSTVVVPLSVVKGSSKLELGSEPLDINKEISVFSRGKMVPYQDVGYKEEVKPEEFSKTIEQQPNSTPSTRKKMDYPKPRYKL